MKKDIKKYLTVATVLVVGLLSSCSNTTVTTPTREVIKVSQLGGKSVIKSGDTVVYTDLNESFGKATGVVNTFTNWWGADKIAGRVGDVVNTKEVGKTARSTDANATSAIIDGNARAIKEVELGVGLEKFRIKNAKP